MKSLHRAQEHTPEAVPSADGPPVTVRPRGLGIVPDLRCIFLVLVVVILGWCTAFNRWSSEAWCTPIMYRSDALALFALAKAFATDGVRPIVFKYAESLGAPFQANWNDYIIVEEFIFGWFSVLLRNLGVFIASNVVVLTAHLLAAAAFYIAARMLGSRKFFACIFAILFGLSAFAFRRNLEHLLLTYYWHIPLGLLVVWWCLDAGSWTRRKTFAALGIAVVHGMQNPYYTNMFVQLVGLAVLISLVQRRPARDIAVRGLVGLVAVLSFCAMNVDTLAYRILYHANDAAMVRTYPGIERYALKPLELFLPALHRWSSLQDWGRNAYFSKALFLGEPASPYLGVIAIAGVAWIGWLALKGIARKDPAGIPRQFWVILWIVLYSVVGGLNGLIGAFGLVLFRATNRFSIVIMATSLLFLAVRLTNATRPWRSLARYALGMGILFVGLWDQLPIPPTMAQIREISDSVVSDKKLTERMEAHLPPRAMVFELPVMEYPEAAPIQKMAAYDHFRPYLHSRSLRYSYGSHKGRARERWQSELAQFRPGVFVSTLEKYGFSAVLVNKKGYDDGGAVLLEAFRAIRPDGVIAESPDFACFALQPSSHPTLPAEFDWNWFGLEGAAEANWRWSQGNATIILYNGQSQAKSVRVKFQLSAVGARRIVVRSSRTELYKRVFASADPPIPLDLPLSLSPGATTLSFDTDQPGEFPANGDPRKLAFQVANFRIEE